MSGLDVKVGPTVGLIDTLLAFFPVTEGVPEVDLCFVSDFDGARETAGARVACVALVDVLALEALSADVAFAEAPGVALATAFGLFLAASAGAVLVFSLDAPDWRTCFRKSSWDARRA
ncbi:hypothetical protein HWV62_9065 [Athelia sp. TMB]|nr:hypothetical protein HWV62_9065 [Athelia sp. TMB]